MSRVGRTRLRWIAAVWMACMLFASPAAALESESVVKSVLPNGLTLITKELPDTDIVSIDVFVKVGQVQENSANAGITGMVTGLLLRGAAGMNAQELAAAFERNGCLVSANATPDFVDLSCRTTRNHAAQALNLLAQVVTKPAMDEAEVTRARNELLESLEKQQTAFGAFYGLFLQQFYPYHPYRLPSRGEVATVKQMTRDALVRYHQEHFTADQTVVVVVGDMDKDRAKTLVEAAFADYAPAPPKAYEVTWAPPVEPRNINFSTGGTLGWVVMGYPAPNAASPDFPAMQAINTLMGTGLSSRMFTELREKRGLAYEMGSMCPTLDGPGHLLLYVVTPGDKIYEVRRLLAGEVNRLKREPISAVEMEETRRRLLGNYLLAREATRNQAYHVGEVEILGLGYRSDEQYLRRLLSLTPEDIQQTAKRYLNNPITIIAYPVGEMPPFSGGGP